MMNFDSRTYSINDFREWHERDQLNLAPEFQRRDVWTDKARSFLIDTIIRGKPIPKFFIRQITNPRTRTTVREVVDGQQRLRTILTFIDNGFAVNRIHNKEFGGRRFSDLPESIQKEFLEYSIAVDVLLDATNQDVLDIFSRINSYAVILNNQEKRNAKYFGEFKQVVTELALDYTSFWQNHRIFRSKELLRMAEAELTSELLIAMIDGIRSKQPIDTFYRDYDDEFPKRNEFIARFHGIMDMIGGVMGDTIATSSFSRVHMFYSLFCSLYHLNHGISNLSTERRSIRSSEYARVRHAIERADAVLTTDEDERNEEENGFYEASRAATTNEASRILRSGYICKQILAALND